jgi:predicted transcriptional regulator
MTVIEKMMVNDVRRIYVVNNFESTIPLSVISHTDILKEVFRN